MRLASIAATSVLLFVGTLAPLSAAEVRLGSVDVGPRSWDSRTFSRFGGGLESLRIVASTDTDCRSVEVTYRNGRRDRVFSGRLQRNNPVRVDLKGGTRVVDRLDFACRTDGRQGQIDVYGDLGRYAGDWRNGPYWNPGWHSPPVSNPTPDWKSLGREDFGRDYGRSRTFSGFRGQDVVRIAVRPIGGNAFCDRITAVFANGQRADLRTPSTTMMRGGVYQMDLPGRRRDVRNVDMVCRAVHSRSVTLQILAIY